MDDIKAELKWRANPEKAAFFPRFFKAGLGEYAEGDKFLGITVPNQRSIAKKYLKSISLTDTIGLLHESWHEERLTALFILVLKYQKGTAEERAKVVEIYLANTAHVNNWDLVDSSAPYILGNWLLDKKDRKILNKLASSKVLWERRIAIISTLEFIRNNQFADTLNLAEKLLGDKHDLMHKAVGWTLREVGKKAPELLTDFLDKHATTMPRTALRYAIERMSEKTRRHYLNLKTA